MKTFSQNRALQVFAIAAVATVGYAGSTAYSKASTREINGKVQRLVLNPEGDVDGFLLEKGPQVHFPPHMSAQLVAVVGVNDQVTIKGSEESSKVFKADTITNTSTKKSVTEAPPDGGPGGGPGAHGAGGPPPPPPHLAGPGAAPGGPGVAGGPGGPKPPGHGPREGLTQLSAEGKIENQLFGPRNDVNGVILSDGTIIRFGPRLASDSKAKFDVGQKLKVTGFGTKNTLGEAIEATEMSN